MERRKNLKIVVNVIFALALVLCTAFVCKYYFGLENSDDRASQPVAESEPIANQDKTIAIDIIPSGSKVMNYKDGYSFVLPKSSNAKIESDDLKLIILADNIEYNIYMESFSTSKGMEEYLSYSNRFTENVRDHLGTQKSTVTINGYEVSLTKWYRNKLKSKENDENYYICADVKLDDLKVCTFFIKSTDEIVFEEDCQAIIGSLELLDESAYSQTRSYWTQETSDVYNELFADKEEAENHKPIWGIYKWGLEYEWNYLSDIESRLGSNFRVLLYYSHFGGDEAVSIQDLTNLLAGCKNAGRIAEVTLQTQHSDDDNMVYDILDGEYDTFIRNYANVIINNGSPLLFRLCNEMNGDWCDYSSYHTSRDADVYIELYKYVYNIFCEEGANAYCLWVWNPNERSFPDYKWNGELEYYPGDSYVDVVGITGYNTGTYYEGETWRSFDEIYGSLYEKTINNYDKPIMITEFACSNVGGDKAQWVNDMFKAIGKYDQIKVAVWWDGCDYDKNGKVARSYLIEENEEVLEEFKIGLKN